MFPRESGIVLHPTSLPGAFGIGEIGPQARWFVDQLKDMGQHLWQVLPLGPTSYGDSPYQSLSTFAGNHLLLSFKDLLENGLLDPGYLSDYPELDPVRIDYGHVIWLRNNIFKKMCADFNNRASFEMKQDYRQFCDENKDWLKDYALFVSLKEKFGGKPWVDWPKALASRDEQALSEARKTLAAELEAASILQFLFHEQWRKLKEYTNKQQIKIIGDIPIFVAHDSADVWARPHLFHLDDEGYPTSIAGVPPDYFSPTGQRWGNPLYRWDLMERDNFEWWVRRIRKSLETVDILRIDHFRGFEAYWEIPAAEETAIHGKWVKGPGLKLFKTIKENLGAAPIIAEDLGIITDEVIALRDRTGFPGMKVLQFIAANSHIEPGDKPENFSRNSVCYTGTHDNDTTVGWYNQIKAASVGETQGPLQNLHQFLGGESSQIHFDMIRTALQSRSNTVLIPLQDVLGMGSECRLNFPGRPEGNWQWRFTPEQITEETKVQLREMTRASGRSRD